VAALIPFATTEIKGTSLLVRAFGLAYTRTGQALLFSNCIKVLPGGVTGGVSLDPDEDETVLSHPTAVSIAAQSTAHSAVANTA
jgi:hypothetical protein